MDPCDAFSLIFTNDTRIGGQVAEGTIILNVPLLKIAGIKEVHLNLRGLVTTYATLCIYLLLVAYLLHVTERSARTRR